MKKRSARRKNRWKKQVIPNVIKIFSIMAACFILLTILSNVARQSEQDQSIFAQLREYAANQLKSEQSQQQTAEPITIEEAVATKEGDLTSKEAEALSDSIFPKSTAERDDLFPLSPELPQADGEFEIEVYLASLEQNLNEDKNEAKVEVESANTAPESASNTEEAQSAATISEEITPEQPPTQEDSDRSNFADEKDSNPELIQNLPPQSAGETDGAVQDNKHTQNSNLQKIPALGTLSIPGINLNAQTKEIPLIGNNWSLFELDNDVGVLEGAGQYPQDNLSMVFAAHVTTIWPFKGPFGNLYRTSLGDEIRYTDENNVYVYKISRYIYAHPSRVDLLFKADGNQIILVTCNGYNLVTDNFDNRLITYATLDRVIPIATIEEFASE